MTRKFCSLIILMAFLLIPAFVFADNWSVYESKSANSHNDIILSENGWKFWRSAVHVFTDTTDWSEVVWMQSDHYSHENGQWLKSVHTVFGETLYKEYNVYDKQKGDFSENWIVFKKDGQYYITKTKELEDEWVLDKSGNIIAIIFVLKDEKGNEIVRREVKRKDVVSSAVSEKEKQLIDKWIKENNLNLDGEPKQRWSGPTSMFHDRTGKIIDRYEYILKNHPDRPWLKK